MKTVCHRAVVRSAGWAGWKLECWRDRGDTNRRGRAGGGCAAVRLRCNTNSRAQVAVCPLVTVTHYAHCRAHSVPHTILTEQQLLQL